MSDDQLIRLSDAIAALTKVAVRVGITGEPQIMILAKEALRAIPAVQVGVKPLEWRTAKISDKWERWIANTIFGQYEILEYSNGSFGWNICFYDEDLEALQYAAKNIEAAKAAVQADHEARIRSALTTQPSPDVAALVAFIEGERDYWIRLAEKDLALQNTLEIAMDYPMQRKMTEAMRKADAFTSALTRLKGGAT